MQIVRDMLSDNAAKKQCDEYINERATRGLRSLGVAKSTNGGKAWQLVGLISLLDPPREDSMSTIRLAQGMGVQVLPYTPMCEVQTGLLWQSARQQAGTGGADVAALQGEGRIEGGRLSIMPGQEDNKRQNLSNAALSVLFSPH